MNELLGPQTDVNVHIEEWEQMRKELEDDYLLILSEIELEEKRLQHYQESEESIVCPFCKHDYWQASHMMPKPNDSGPNVASLAHPHPAASSSSYSCSDNVISHCIPSPPPPPPPNSSSVFHHAINQSIDEMLLICNCCGFKMRTRNHSSLSAIKNHLDSVLRYHQDNCNETIQFLVMESSDDMDTMPNHDEMREKILIAGRDHVVATCTKCFLSIEIL